MLEAVPAGIFSRNWVARWPGGPTAEIRVSGMRERAEFTLDGRRFRLGRERLLGGAFLLEDEHGTIARAVKPSAWRRRFELGAEGEEWALEADSVWSRSFSLVRRGERVGTVGRSGVFRRRAWAELPDGWPPEVQLFVFWLALVLWRRADAAAAAS